MLLEPGERTTTTEKQKERLQRLLNSKRYMIFVAQEEHSGRLAGYVEIEGGEYRRNRHSAYIVTGILRAFTGRGIGTRLFQAMEQWARQHHFQRLELTVMTHNAAAIALYSRRGFAVEGTRRHALMINREYVDEYYMAKLLE